jgi:hypothetical protein
MRKRKGHLGSGKKTQSLQRFSPLNAKIGQLRCSKKTGLVYLQSILLAFCHLLAGNKAISTHLKLCHMVGTYKMRVKSLPGQIANAAPFAQLSCL